MRKGATGLTCLEQPTYGRYILPTQYTGCGSAYVTDGSTHLLTSGIDRPSITTIIYVHDGVNAQRTRRCQGSSVYCHENVHKS